MMDQEVLAEMGRASLLNQVRVKFGAACARIEQAMAQRRPLPAIEIRRMEFDFARQIIAFIREAEGRK